MFLPPLTCCARARARAYTHTQTHTHVHILTHIHTRTRTYTHINTYTHTRTRTHTSSLSLSFFLSLSLVLSRSLSLSLSRSLALSFSRSLFSCSLSRSLSLSCAHVNRADICTHTYNDRERLRKRQTERLSHRFAFVVHVRLYVCDRGSNDVGSLKYYAKEHYQMELYFKRDVAIEYLVSLLIIVTS